MVQLKRLFRASDLTDEQRAWLMNPAHWEPARGGLYVTPPLELVAGLSRLGRGQIYSVLAEAVLRLRSSGFDIDASRAASLVSRRLATSSSR